MAGSHPAFPAAAHGTSKFEWLVDGGLLLWRFDWDQPGPPSAISAISRDDSESPCSMLYADGRGVTRIYRLVVDGGTWRMSRDAPGLSQRMTGSISEDGDTIFMRGEMSRDGRTWEPDLDVTYTRNTAQVP